MNTMQLSSSIGPSTMHGSRRPFRQCFSSRGKLLCFQSGSRPLHHHNGRCTLLCFHLHLRDRAFMVTILHRHRFQDLNMRVPTGQLSS
ncbi:hypothetical protein PVAP13_8KG350914 [Panicum virgatum]|uniref:Uncharacterized protein n=1 Tax=Panicum virgatum TaxID=38727 RepID=A0A8T0PZG7_PANVG|nr:hypothetical protein PVAP13_8KG350914 [Panicum virgatum]